LLEKLGELQGVYVPSCWIDPTKKTDEDGIPAIERRILPSLNNVDFPTNQIVPFGKPVHDRFSLEIARGCTRGCRFCQAGMIYRPVRERSLPVLDGILRKGLSETGYEELSFLSLSSGDFSTLTGLFEQSIARCAAEKVSISLPSLRVGSVNPRLLSMIASIRRTGVTLAPEAGSQRLRDVINKGIREEDLLEHVSSLFDLGWNAVKLYFMIGLPTETRADLEAIRDLALKVLQCAGPKRKRLQVTVSISPFVPKPHTPFQWERQLSRDECRERIDFLKEILRPYRKIKLRWHEPNMSFLEGVFSRGDRSLAELVEKAYQRGALFSSWIEHLDIRVWEELMEELSIDPGAYLRERAEQEPLPWDHLRSGVNKSFLLRERRNAFQGEMTSDCRYGACHNCGVCTGMDAPGHSGSKNEPIRPIVNSSMRDQKAGAELVSADRMGSGNKEMLLRIWHEKTGFAKFLSQLELQTILERSLRRAEIPMAFSEGFHPSPILSFGRALPVGVASREEWFCVWLQKLIDPSSVMQSLAETMPMGLNLVRVERMEGKKRHPQADFEDFFLSYKLPADQVPPHLRKWDRLMERSEHLWRHETKRGVRTVDIRPFLSEVKANSSTMVLRFCWREGYLSPMKLIHAVDPDLQPGQFELTKFRQWMPQSAMIPDLQ
ncbi:MAG: TIGR03936 family radical SAM-associated protein, partial [Desulfovibrionales bacterium]